MPACAPHKLAEILARKCPPENVHTVVLWTKNVANILYHAELYDILQRYDQIFLLVSITGMGGSVLEPQVPKAEAVLSLLPEIINFVGHPRRIAVRFDPILKFRTRTGEILTNLSFFPILAQTISKLGIKQLFASWVQMYPKVANRLERYGLENIVFSHHERKQACEQLLKSARRHGLELNGCCIPELPNPGCINGMLLNELHPLGRKASVKRSKGQRSNCNCTESWDVGWYYTCAHGCAYCYAQPKIY
ncbi:DUF1848 family protein [candidate division KSB1 bacterium]|nr:DUF1848 family protein [candidate division KSB1 bacterium]